MITPQQKVWNDTYNLLYKKGAGHSVAESAANQASHSFLKGCSTEQIKPVKAPDERTKTDR